MNTTVVNVKKANLTPRYRDLIHWCADPSHIYIGRNMSFYVDGAFASKWANPFKVKKPSKGPGKGSSKGYKYKMDEGAGTGKMDNYSLEESLEKYEEYVRASPELMRSLPELRGKTLGCWCSPAPCHGDVLVKLVNESG